MLLATSHCAHRRGWQCGHAASAPFKVPEDGSGHWAAGISAATTAAAQVRLICTYFRARPIAPCRERQVSARTTSAPQLRVGGGIPTSPTLVWTQSNFAMGYERWLY